MQTTEPPRQSGPRRLERRPDEGHLGGVCAGLADYFNIDPLIVRIAAAVLILSGPGILAYILAWIFVPVAEGPARSGPTTWSWRLSDADKGAQVVGIVLVGVAIAFLWGGWWAPARGWFFPVGLMALGAWLLLRRDDVVDDGPGGPADTAPAGPPSPTSPSGDAAGPPVAALADTTSSWPPPGPGDTTEVTTAVDDRTDAPAGEPADPTGRIWPGPPAGPPDPPWGGGRDHPGDDGTPPPVRDRRRRVVTSATMGALLVWTGLAWLLGVTLLTGLAVGLCIVGTGFVVGAFVGGTWGLLLPGMVLAGSLVVASTVDIPLRGPIGERQWVPVAVDDLDGRFEVAMGEGTLDLTQVVLDDGQRVDVAASVGIGHLIVDVPLGVGLEVTTESGVGETVILDERNSGIGVDVDRRIPALDGQGTFVLDLQVGVGQIEVRYLGQVEEAPALR